VTATAEAPASTITVSPAASYRGRRHRNRSVTVTAYNLKTGWREPLRHVVKHSPTGFEWGYEGSGPAELARCLLIDVLGPAAVCPECNGTERCVWAGADGQELEPYDPVAHAEADPELIGRCWCDGGFRNLPYQDFKREVVARFGYAGWQIDRGAILAWLVAHYPEAPPTWLTSAGTTAVELPPELPG
jgi:hypothetical protein